MKALILNSGLGKRMGALTSEHPKCMTEISNHDTILSYQLRSLDAAGIHDVVMTTGLFDQVLMDYCRSLKLDIRFTFVKNEMYAQTNYIYSIECARDFLMGDDILLFHGDLVFEKSVLDRLLTFEGSGMVVSSALPLPEKDFKAVVRNGKIDKIGIAFFQDALAAQPLYKLMQDDWMKWLNAIREFCQNGNTNVYAEDAFNTVSERCDLRPCDVEKLLCSEVDTPEDLEKIKEQVKNAEKKTVYMCFSTDMVHSGHIGIIRKAAQLGKLTVGILTDEAVASYKHYPMMPYEERKALFENIVGVDSVVEQKTLSYKDNLIALKPDYIVHGDDWQSGVQKPVRDEVAVIAKTYGASIVEYPYSKDDKYIALERQALSQLSIPDVRRGRLRKLLAIKKCISIIEAHSGITGLIAEKTVVFQDGKAYQFDGMWVSSLCDSTAKGKPDIELVDMSSRLRTIDDIMEVTSKPIILDGDTGGLTEHFVYTVKTLERMGVSAVIIEDKTGLKKNSLFGTEVEQTQDSIENFCQKISAGKNAQKTKEFMIIARIESLILERGMEDALERAYAFTKAGADGIMIHSRRKDPTEIFEFVQRFRDNDSTTPIVVVPTSFNSVTEAEFAARGVNIVIYANQLTRSGFPAMQKTAQLILENHRAKEADDICMPIKDIITLIPEE